MKYEIPYSQLQLIGLSPEMVDAMPGPVKDKIMEGDFTPMIVFRREMGNGVSIELPMRMRMETDESGTPGLRLYPINIDMKNSMNVGVLSQQLIESGDVIRSNGHYMQRDPETNCIIKMPENAVNIDERISELEKVHDIELGQQQKEQLKEGRPVELNVGGEIVTVGLDLRDKEHFKTLSGDMKEWDRQKQIAYDLAHPEFIGLVQTDQNVWEYLQYNKAHLIQSGEDLRHRTEHSQKSGVSL